MADIFDRENTILNLGYIKITNQIFKDIREISIMKQLLWYVSCCWTLSLVSASAAQASPDIKSSANFATGNAASLGGFSSTDFHATTATPAVASGILAQTPPAPPAPETPGSAPAKPATSPSSQESKELQDRLNNINSSPSNKFDSYNPRTSPAFSIFNPVGFGADKNLVFFALSYQNRTRYSRTSDGEAGFGIGLGDATNSVGAELSYSINSFGSTSAFGSGAFNIKVHKRLSEDSSVAIGWNQFIQTNFGPGRNGNAAAVASTNNGSDYPTNSYYAVGTKIFRTREDINEPFSRVAVTGGVGSGVFLPFNENILNPTGLNVIGSVGVRIARPVSAVIEWTGQDLAAGISIAPFENFPLVITPAFRDIAGISNSANPGAAPAGARFILGASVAFNF